MAVKISCTKSITHKRIKPLNFIQYARENREEGFFNDVCINVESECIPANRIILSCRSPFFEKIFKNTSKTSSDPSVKIDGAKGKMVKAIIDYFYSESIEINSENVMDLLAASDYLKVDEVMQFCFQFLQSVVEPENSVALLNAARLYGSDTLTLYICQFISVHFDTVIQTSDFKFLSESDFTNFLTSVKRNLIPESSLYQALICWVRNDQTKRQNLFANLFQQTITLSELLPDFIEDVLLNESLIKENAISYQLVLTTFSKLLKEQRAADGQQHHTPTNQTSPSNDYVTMNSPPPLPPKRLPESPRIPMRHKFPSKQQLPSPKQHGSPVQRRSTLSLKHTFENQIATYAQELLPRVIGVGNGSYGKNVSDVYNLYGQTLLNYPSLPEETGMYCSLFLSNTVFCIGGDTITSSSSCKRPTNKVWKMNLKEKALEWLEAAPMNNQRFEMGATVYHGGLVVAGGNGGNGKALNSTEFYEIDKNKWKTISSMNLPRQGNSLVSCEGCLYSLGGAENYFSAERLEKLKGKWKFVKPMQTGRSNFAAVNCKGMIYAIGGENDDLAEEWDDCERLKSVERFNSKENTWCYVRDMHFRRYDHSACVFDEKIFVFGGKDEIGSSIYKIECYNPANNTWLVVGEISSQIHGHSIVPV